MVILDRWGSNKISVFVEAVDDGPLIIEVTGNRINRGEVPVTWVPAFGQTSESPDWVKLDSILSDIQSVVLAGGPYEAMRLSLAVGLPSPAASGRIMQAGAK